jgi:hypothetical protein
MQHAMQPAMQPPTLDTTPQQHLARVNGGSTPRSILLAEELRHRHVHDVGVSDIPLRVGEREAKALPQH